jgi:hypothetical protein
MGLAGSLGLPSIASPQVGRLDRHSPGVALRAPPLASGVVSLSETYDHGRASPFGRRDLECGRAPSLGSQRLWGEDRCLGIESIQSP